MGISGLELKHRTKSREQKGSELFKMKQNEQRQKSRQKLLEQKGSTKIKKKNRTSVKLKVGIDLLLRRVLYRQERNKMSGKQKVG